MAKKKSPSAIKRISECFDLESIRLDEIAASRARDRESDTGRIGFQIEVRGDFGNEWLVYWARFIAVFPTEKEPLVKVNSLFRAAYKKTGERKMRLSRSSIQEFGQSVVIRELWPYFRHIVHNTATEMGFASLVLPSFRSSLVGDWIRKEEPPPTVSKKTPKGKK